MISHKHKYIYIHIPKTGGNSVEAALLENIGIPPERCNDEGLTKAERQEYRIWYTHGEIDVQHRKLGQYKKWREREYFTFSFVRNPWDRYVSEYFYIYEHHDNREEFRQLFPTFRDFVMEDALSNWCYYAHDFQQIEFILNANEHKLVDFIGKCETLQDDFDHVCRKLNLGHMKLPRTNQTAHTHYSTYYDYETKMVTAKKYKADIQFFNYSFEQL